MLRPDSMLKLLPWQKLTIFLKYDAVTRQIIHHIKHIVVNANPVNPYLTKPRTHFLCSVLFMFFYVPFPFWLHILMNLCQNTVDTFILLSCLCMIILLAAFCYLLSTTQIRADLHPISLEPMFYAVPSLQHKIMTVLVVVENVQFVDGLICGFRFWVTRRHPDASV